MSEERNTNLTDEQAEPTPKPRPLGHSLPLGLQWYACLYKGDYEDYEYNMKEMRDGALEPTPDSVVRDKKGW